MSHPAVPDCDAAVAVLDELKAAGVAVEARVGNLRLSPASSVDAALLARVKAYKPAILTLLAVEVVAESLKLPADALPAARRGDRETPEEARDRQAAAIERLRLDRQAFVEEARKAGVYRGLANDTGVGVRY
jgi:hypothetical protein